MFDKDVTIRTIPEEYDIGCILMGLLNYLSKPIIGWLNHEASQRNLPLSDFTRIKYEIKLCDVLLIEGRSRVSDVIRLTTQSPWTHAVLYIGRLHDIEDPDLKKIIGHHYKGEPGDRLIIESLLGQGTIVHNLEVYANEHLRICRPSRLSFNDIEQVIRYAVSRLGVDYDVRQIIDLARLLFPWSILPRRWRSSLFKHNPGRSTRTVCSTMIAEAFAFVQFPILPLVKRSADDKVQMFRRNPKLCTPSDFDYSPYFKIIKYPFVDIHYHDDHHLLPWHGTGELDGDENMFYMEAETHPTPEDVEEAISQAVADSEDQAAKVADPSDVDSYGTGEQHGDLAAVISVDVPEDKNGEHASADEKPKNQETAAESADKAVDTPESDEPRIH